MFDINNVQAIMARYDHIHPEDSYLLDQYWNDLSGALVQDTNGTIRYLLNNATPEELDKISEVTDELVERTQSIELIKAIRTAYCKYPETLNDHLLFSNLNLSITIALKDKKAAQQLLAWKPTRTD
ncbi:hypothetical protein [Bifidobacterium stellenboschense]|uniref:Uncharacterized protein n=1 Tax=Bifidobacterium stellenboschense TaxID=762211 RepID=A0A087DGE3_9BIFI|nr:hypothetical protein [Bifidobacterium stellenboschense]KFI94593.1 hypothetical protein BSTEL_1263 [Bifidobacterium stellenboschense]